MSCQNSNTVLPSLINELDDELKNRNTCEIIAKIQNPLECMVINVLLSLSDNHSVVGEVEKCIDNSD